MQQRKEETISDSSDSDDNDDNNTWHGTAINALYYNNTPWNYYCTELKPSHHHTVLFQMPATLDQPPKPHCTTDPCFWNPNVARMPFSEKSLFKQNNENESILKPRWNIIKSALSKQIRTVKQLEDAIFSYNFKNKKFLALSHLFKDILDEDETNYFFNTLLPNITRLALQLPDLIRAPIPLLKQGKPHSVSISQEQIASLLANAFLCTFPWTKDSVTYPGLNFSQLFECDTTKEPSVTEKIKCLLHYFRRVCNNVPKGIVTFERKHLPNIQLPRWDQIRNCIADIDLHITRKGTIESDGKGFLQVDFANCMIGGGVLRCGCVQEEIRFVICPELIVSRLFTEQLAPNEALLITGAECYSTYQGYADTFVWTGNCRDDTPHDGYGRRRTSIVAIDALYYSNPSMQFLPSKMIRELNKAYVGFYEHCSNTTKLAPVATGNWGCGAFRGNLHLKALIQIMACTAANRNIVYYTFGDKQLESTIFDFYKYLVEQHITIVQLWRYLCKFTEAKLSSLQLLSFIKQTHLNATNLSKSNPLRSQRNLRNFVTIRKPPKTKLPTSNSEITYSNPSTSASKAFENDTELTSDEDVTSSQNIIPRINNNQNKYANNKSMKKTTKPKTKSEAIVSYLFSSDEEDSGEQCESLLTTFDNFDNGKTSKKNNAPQEMEVDSEQNETDTLMDAATTTNVKTDYDMNRIEKMKTNKISDYFQVLSAPSNQK